MYSPRPNAVEIVRQSLHKCPHLQNGAGECCRGQGFVVQTGRVPYTRHKLDVAIPTSQATLSDQLHPDKEQLRTTILQLREQDMNYREIAQKVGLHWTRIQQIVKSAEIRRGWKMAGDVNELQG